MLWARNWQTILGTLALLAALALTSPGVRLARAGEGDASAKQSADTTAAPSPSTAAQSAPLSSAGPACGPVSPAEAGRNSDLVIMALQHELAARAAAAAAASASSSGSSESEGVSLNNRGYNYPLATAH